MNRTRSSRKRRKREAELRRPELMIHNRCNGCGDGECDDRDLPVYLCSEYAYKGIKISQTAGRTI